MNAYKSLLFFCSIVAGLVLLCVCFPADGIALGEEIFLRFPTLAEAMGHSEEEEEYVAQEEVDTLPTLTPEELLQMRQDSLSNMQIEKFRNFCTTDVARIYMPNDDEMYFDDLWKALQDADKRHVRIMHYGDSQIECDRITSLLRQRFQEEFGGIGVGLVPALQSIPTFTLSSSISPDNVPQYLAYGPKDRRLDDNFYGPLARVTHIPDHATIRLKGIGSKDYSCSRSFSRITVITRHPATLLMTTSTEDEEPQEMELTSGEEPCFYTASLGRSVSNITLEVQGETDILGIQLDGTTGISMDNIPMRGSSGSDLITISRASTRPFFNRENVKLFILQYGGNSVPYINRKMLHSFKERIKSLIRTFNELAPDAKVLFIGPADMARNREDGEMESYPILPELNDSLRTAANEAGAAYWNMYSAMGGRGSIIRWVEASPQLAGEDYIHFTPLGAKKIARLLYDTLHLYYRFYLFRTGQEKAELTAEDSAAVIIDQEEILE